MWARLYGNRGHPWRRDDPMVRYYRELTRLEMEAVDKEETVVLIPIGALEQHGNQCPLGTDEIISEAVARRIRETLDREIPDYPMLIFPPVPWASAQSM